MLPLILCLAGLPVCGGLLTLALRETLGLSRHGDAWISEQEHE